MNNYLHVGTTITVTETIDMGGGTKDANGTKDVTGIMIKLMPAILSLAS
jgi:hypothetical protein